MRQSEPDDDAWHQAVFAQYVGDEEVHQAARLEMARLAEGSDLRPQDSDLQAARNYLKVCIRRMSVVEVQGLSVHDVAMLWARGGHGAARFRRDKGRKKRRLRREP